MPFTYKIGTGEMFHNDNRIGIGYSGHGDDVNQPAFENVPQMGPLPEGWYTIGPMEPLHGKLGKDVLPLMPDADDEMYGRSAFYIHGDNEDANFSASEGCIVLPHGVRSTIAALVSTGDNRLQVIA